MQARPSREVTDRNSATFDLLLIDADEQRALFTVRAIQSSMPVRCAQKTTGRDALASFQRARFNVIVCRPHLGDIVCRHWIRTVRSGKFGYSATPVIVLCDAIELHELGPMVDNNTLLVPESDTAVLTAALQALKVGAAKPTVLVVVTSYYVASPDGGRTTNLVVRDPESRVLILVDNVPLYQGL